MRRNLLGIAAVIACGLASAATSPLRVSYPRSFPAWKLLDRVRVHGTPTLDLWVSKSGKEGIGLTLLVMNCGEQPTRVEVRYATLELADRCVGRLEAPLLRSVAPGETAHVYLGLAFDNERLWNEGRRQGTVKVGLRVDGKAIELASRARHILDGFHRAVPRAAPPSCDEKRSEHCPYREVPRPRAPSSLPSSLPSGTVLEPVRP